MLKKLTALISSAAIVMSMFAAVSAGAEEAQPENTTGEAAAEEESFTPTKKQELLLALGIISFNSYGTYDNDAEMTRADFAAICGKILNINETMTADCMYFTDVTPDSWFAYTVNQLTERGVISESEDKLFNPERSVSLEEAVKMLACLMGFNAYAQINGGYPDGYMRVASEQELLDGVGSGEKFTQGMMCELVYNALHANVMKTDYTLNTASMSVDYNETLLSYYKDIYFDDGMVEAVYGTSISEYYKAGADSVTISGTNFYTGDVKDINNYLGYNVTVYYEVDDNNEYTLKYIEPFDTKEIVVYSDEVEEFTGLGGSLNYYEGVRRRSAKLESDAIVIRNGSIVETGVDEAFSTDNGEIHLIDNDKDGTYEIANIYDFDTVVINSYNRDTSVIIDKIDPKKKIELEDVDYLTILSDSGETLDETALTQNSVIDVALSDGHAIIYVNASSITGEIESISVNDNEVAIGGTIYEYMPQVYNYYHLAAGDSGLFKLNRYNRIAYFDSSGISGEPGYIINVDYTNETCEQLMVKLLDKTGTISWINLSDNMKLDGSEFSMADKSKLEYFIDSAVMYQLNSKNEISKIDTYEMGSKESETSVQKTMSLNSVGHRWMSDNKMFDRNVILDSDAVIFKVPPASSEDREDDAYSIAATSDLVSNRVYQVEAYKSGSGTYSTMIVWYENKYYQNSREAFIIVEKVTNAVTADGEEVYNIDGWQNGSKVNVQLTYPHDIVPKRGDCIRVGRDKNNIAGLVEIHYDIKRNGSGATDEESDWHWNDVAGEPYDAINNYWNGTFNDLQADFRLGFGYAVGIDGSLLKMSYKRGSDSVDEILPIGGDIPVIVYDYKTDKFKEGSVQDIMTMESYGGNNSIIVANFSWGDLTEIYVVNNRYDQ